MIGYREISMTIRYVAPEKNEKFINIHIKIHKTNGLVCIYTRVHTHTFLGWLGAALFSLCDFGYLSASSTRGLGGSPSLEQRVEAERGKSRV